MKISIVTPSYNLLSWLPLCVQSIRDQRTNGLEIEHLIQDGESDDGTQEWLADQKDLDIECDRDDGMYDAINRGLSRARGEILAYLNCDEQYLPGALEDVASYFDRNPRVDVVFGDYLVVGPRGEFRAFRKVVCPTALITRLHTMPVGTCAMFFRRSLIDDSGMFFDARYRSIADKLWGMELVRRKIRMGRLKTYTSAFGTTGQNLAYSDAAREESRAFFKQLGALRRMLIPVAKLGFRIQKLVMGCYRQAPFSYSIYTHDSPIERLEISVPSPTFRLAEFR